MGLSSQLLRMPRVSVWTPADHAQRLPDLEDDVMVCQTRREAVNVLQQLVPDVADRLIAALHPDPDWPGHWRLSETLWHAYSAFECHAWLTDHADWVNSSRTIAVVTVDRLREFHRLIEAVLARPDTAASRLPPRTDWYYHRPVDREILADSSYWERLQSVHDILDDAIRTTRPELHVLLYKASY